MSEPTTAAGRAMFADFGHPNFVEKWNDAILAIEAEARADCETECRAQLIAERAAALDEARAAVERLDYRMVEWWAPDGKTYSLHQVVTWSRALAAIDALRERDGER